MDSHLQWFAVRVRPKAERVVADALRGKGYTEFLPLYRQRRRWSDRVVDIQVPLFPGYLFCQFDVGRRLPILKTPGVLCVVSTGRLPEPVDDAEIAALRILVDSRLQLEPWPYQHIGQRVQILGGPLAGAEGTLLSVGKHGRLVVSITLLQRSVSVEIPEASVWPSEGVVPLRA